MARIKSKAKKNFEAAKAAAAGDAKPPAAAPAPQKRKRKRMWRSAYYREIKACQRATHNLVPKSPMHRLVREIADKYVAETGGSVRWKQDALDLLHVEAEEYVRSCFFRANNYLVNAGMCTLRPQDIKAAHADMLREAAALRNAAG